MKNHKRKNKNPNAPKVEIHSTITSDSIDKIERPYKRYFEESEINKLRPHRGAFSEACDYCPNCVAVGDWCPFMDDD